MADNGKMYYGLGEDIIAGMKKICSQADYILPNITESCFLTDSEYDDANHVSLVKKLQELGAKNVILTGVEEMDSLGALFYDGTRKIYCLKERRPVNYHGTGDIFSSIIIAYILNGATIEESLDKATDFVINSIKKTESDPTHNYGVKFEDVLKEEKYGNI